MDNAELRRQTKQRVLRWLTVGSTKIEDISSGMMRFNGWRKETNLRILKEMSECKEVYIEGGMARLNTESNPMQL